MRAAVISHDVEAARTKAVDNTGRPGPVVGHTVQIDHSPSTRGGGRAPPSAQPDVSTIERLIGACGRGSNGDRSPGGVQQRPRAGARPLVQRQTDTSDEHNQDGGKHGAHLEAVHVVTGLVLRMFPGIRRRDN